MGIMSIRDLQQRCWRQAEDKGFHEDRPKEFLDTITGLVPNPTLPLWQGNKIALMHSELSEALEELRSGRSAYETYYPARALPSSLVAEVGVDDARKLIDREDAEKLQKPEGVPSELADVVIRVLDFCGTEGIDLQEIIEEKLAYNATRGHKHGKKF